MAASDVNGSGVMLFIEATLGGTAVHTAFPPDKQHIGTVLCDRTEPALYYLTAISGTKAWHVVNATTGGAWQAFSVTG